MGKFKKVMSILVRDVLLNCDDYIFLGFYKNFKNLFFLPRLVTRINVEASLGPSICNRLIASEIFDNWCCNT